MYGTSFAAVSRVVASGKIPLLECMLLDCSNHFSVSDCVWFVACNAVDIKGAQTVNRERADWRTVFVFLAPPSVDELVKRLQGRYAHTLCTLICFCDVR